MAIIWYILLYSVLGFVLESAYAWLTGQKGVRKCHLLLPVCPVYGVGAVGILMLPQMIQQKVWLLMPCGALICTAIEYAMGVFYEKVWRVSFWSYTGLVGSVQGRICPSFSLAWGVLSVVLVYVVHPALTPLFKLLPESMAIPALLLFAADSVLTGLRLRATTDKTVLRWWKTL